MSAAPSTLAVVIVNYNTRERTLECIESVAAQRIPGCEIVVVDNGSTDGSVEAFRTARPEIVVIDAADNLGFARGVNVGVAASTSAYVLLLNPDTTVLPGALEALLEFAIAQPAHGVYGGRTLRQDGSLDPSSCWGAPSLWSLFCFATGLSTAFKRSAVFDPESLGSWQRDTVREVPVVTGCLLLARRTDWDQIGGMDERFFLYGEDAEFSQRAIAKGFHPVIVPQATIVHDVGASTGSSGFKMCMVMAGKTTFLRQQWRRPAATLGVFFLLAGTGLRTLLEAAARGRKTKSWTIVWKRRADWLPGYPRAEATLFGRVPAAELNA
ncbi:MAG: glycosyltransferase [Nocardioidaceae bacterium]|nr:glycosyltransferase [Nocardioidaceae bacterium]